MRAAIIFNPTARGNQARRCLARLQELSSEAELLPTPGPGQAAALAAEACRRGCDTIVAAGGDGTVSEVADGLGSVPGATDAVRLGVLPLGTINVFARELGIPPGLKAAWELIRSGTETRLDLPAVALTDGDQRRQRRFVQLAGCGLDSRAIAAVNWEWKQRVGPLAYVAAVWQAARGPQPQVEATAGGRAVRGELALIGNGRLYGGAVTVFPEADGCDGLLEVRVFPRVTLLTLCRFGLAWWRRRPLSGCGTVALRGERVELRSVRPMPVEVDGDNVGWLPADFTVQRAALRVLAPVRAGAQPSG
jgi:YegS/Rv2252/BmrU family lipid kinase